MKEHDETNAEVVQQIEVVTLPQLCRKHSSHFILDIGEVIYERSLGWMHGNNVAF